MTPKCHTKVIHPMKSKLFILKAARFDVLRIAPDLTIDRQNWANVCRLPFAVCSYSPNLDGIIGRLMIKL